jgi:hypothetical protein
VEACTIGRGMKGLEEFASSTVGPPNPTALLSICPGVSYFLTETGRPEDEYWLGLSGFNDAEVKVDRLSEVTLKASL